MMNTEQAEREAERRFRDYEAEAMCTCGVYRIATSALRSASPGRAWLAFRSDGLAPVQRG